MNAIMKTLFLFIADTRISIIDFIGPMFAARLLSNGYIGLAAVSFGVGVIVSAVADIAARGMKS